MAAPVRPAAARFRVVEAVAERRTVRLDFDIETGAAQHDPLDGDAEAATVRPSSARYCARQGQPTCHLPAPQSGTAGGWQSVAAGWRRRRRRDENRDRR